MRSNQQEAASDKNASISSFFSRRSSNAKRMSLKDKLMQNQRHIDKDTLDHGSRRLRKIQTDELPK